MSNSTQEGTPALVKIFTGIIVLLGGYFNPGIISSLALSQTIASLSVVHGAASVQPLEQITIISQPGGTIIVKDGEGRIYLRTSSDEKVAIRAGGALGTHTVAFIDKNGDTAARTSFRVEAKTDIADGGRISELFRLLYNGMIADSPGGYQEITWNGRAYRYFVNWVLDNNNTMKGMKYFSPYGGDLVDLLRLTQKPDGMIWSFVNTGDGDSHYFETAYTPLGYFRRDRDAWFVRQPVENHVEYNYVNMMYQVPGKRAATMNGWRRTLTVRPGLLIIV